MAWVEIISDLLISRSVYELEHNLLKVGHLTLHSPPQPNAFHFPIQTLSEGEVKSTAYKMCEFCNIVVKYREPFYTSRYRPKPMYTQIPFVCVCMCAPRSDNAIYLNILSELHLDGGIKSGLFLIIVMTCVPLTLEELCSWFN